MTQGQTHIRLSLADLSDFARKVEGFVEKQDVSRAVILGLYGELGAGKTTFTQQFLKMLGVEEQVTSPTFVIEKIFRVSDRIFSTIVHIDAYRIEDAQEMIALGFRKQMEDANTLIVIEWPEKIQSILPSTMLEVRFSVMDENTRLVSTNFDLDEKK